MTQLVFSYVAAPFLALSFSGSVGIWANLWFVVHIGIAAAMAFFASPGKKWLAQRQQKRIGRAKRLEELEGIEKESMGVLGLPENPDEDLQELAREMMTKKNELVARRNSMAQEKRKTK